MTQYEFQFIHPQGDLVTLRSASPELLFVEEFFNKKDSDPNAAIEQLLRVQSEQEVKLIVEEDGVITSVMGYALDYYADLLLQGIFSIYTEAIPLGAILKVYDCVIDWSDSQGAHNKLQLMRTPFELRSAVIVFSGPIEELSPFEEAIAHMVMNFTKMRANSYTEFSGLVSQCRDIVRPYVVKTI